MLRLPDSWVWDSWYAVADGWHHAFYLRASRGLRDPDRRHRHPSVGHAVSSDLREWTVLPDALAVSESPAFDDWTTWTGSIVRDDARSRWVMAYTGSSRADGGLVQRIGFATSLDLLTWDKTDPTTVLGADPRWYETLGTSDWFDEAWRDPFLFRGDDGLWHRSRQPRPGSRARRRRPRDVARPGHLDGPPSDHRTRAGLRAAGGHSGRDRQRRSDARILLLLARIG